MPDKLSPKARRLRLEALAQGLRRFRLTDDGELSLLVSRTKLPTVQEFSRALGNVEHQVRLGVTTEFVAKSVLAHLAQLDGRSAEYEDPFSEVPAPGRLTAASLHSAVKVILNHYKRAIEDRRGYTLLWNGGRPKNENAAQALFELTVRGWCESLGLDLQAEVNLGRGPVDFRLSSGPHLKAVIEMKLAKHRKWWHGLSQQLPTYMRVDDVRAGYFVTIAFSDADLRKLERIETVIDSVRDRVGYEITTVVVDARRNKPSASKT